MGKLGLTCAACHTGRFTYGNTEFLVDGGSAMSDVVKLNTAIGLALIYTKLDWLRFNRFALRLLGPDANNDAARAALHEQLDAVAPHESASSTSSTRKANPDGDTEGYGRLDALNRIGNLVFCHRPRQARELRRQHGAGALSPHLGSAVVRLGAIQRLDRAADGAQCRARQLLQARASPIRPLILEDLPTGCRAPSTAPTSTTYPRSVPHAVQDGRHARRQAAQRRRRHRRLPDEQALLVPAKSAGWSEA